MTSSPEHYGQLFDLKDLQSLQQRLVQAVRRVCPAWLAGDAEDLVQDALEKLLRMEQASKAPTEINATYLNRLAYSTVIDEIRKRQRRPEMGTEAGGEGDRVADETAATGVGADTGEAIEACLAQQVAERRRAVTLHLLGHTVGEIATLMQCKAKRAENWVYRGITQLRLCLQEKGMVLS